MTTICRHLRACADDDRPAIVTGDGQWSWRERIAAAAARAAYVADRRAPGPPHVGVLLDNVPEFIVWLDALLLGGSTMVGINPTRRGAELARDITHTDCQLIVTDREHLPLLDGLELGAAAGRVLVVDDPSYGEALAPYAGAALPNHDPDPATQCFLLFTSGSTGAPKACVCTQGRFERVANVMAGLVALTADDVTYGVMPLFHSNALFTAYGPSTVAGAALAMRPRFSASGFLADVRRFGATYANYVGKPLSYVLATPEQPDDADNPLRRVYGNEAAATDIDRFARRFGCIVNDGYGSTETGVSISRVAGMPPDALGLAPEGVKILDPVTAEECPRASFDEHGRLINGEEAIGEIVNTAGAAGFEGYWRNPEADAERLRGSTYWSGDLGYRDEADYIYFAGRSADWLRVDGENFAAAPVERIMARYPGVVLAAVYAVPDADVGDQAMVALQMVDPASFDPADFASFLAGQSDLGPKWVPRFVRVTEELPITQTNKVLKRVLVRQRWDSGDAQWWRPGRSLAYEPFTAADADALRAHFAERGRSHVLDA